MANKTKSGTGTIRNLAGATAFSMAVMSGSVYGLGLGNIELDSALNQPFSAEIEVLTDVPGEAADLAVQLASREAFSRAGIDRANTLSKLRFNLQKRGNRSFIVVTSNEPIIEPFLNFLVEVDWKRGNLVREYTVLLDPPTFVAARPQTTVSADLAEVGDSAVNDPTLPMRIDRSVAADIVASELNKDQLAAEIAAVDEALMGKGASSAASSAGDSLAKELAEIDDLMVVTGSGDPLFGGGKSVVNAGTRAVSAIPGLDEVADNNGLPIDDSQRIPETVDDAVFGAADTGAEKAYSATAVSDLDELVATLDRELLTAGKAKAKPAAKVAAPAASATGTLAPVRNGQTLWGIASANRVPGVTVEQMMVALLRANPNAFMNGNMNSLKRGSILRVPTADEVAGMDAQVALSNVEDQHALWKKVRDKAGTTSAPAAPQTTAKAPVEKVAEKAKDATLQLVADTQEVDVSGTDKIEANTAITADVEAATAQLRNKLSLAEEQAESERLRAEEMDSRVSDLETAIQKSNRLLELRNAELARLQTALADNEIAAAAEAASKVETARADMAAQLKLVKEVAAKQAEAAKAQSAAAEAEIAKLRGLLSADQAQEAEAEAAARAAANAENLAAEAAANEAAAAAEAASAEAAAKAQAEADMAAEMAAKAQAEAEAEAKMAAEQQAAEQLGITSPVGEADLEPVTQGDTQTWYENLDLKDPISPHLTAENAKMAGLGLLGLLGLGMVGARTGRSKKEEVLFGEDSYETPDNAGALGVDADETAYGQTAITDELHDETVDATDMSALDSTMADGTATSNNVDVLQEADVYLSYGLADRAEELLDGAIESDPNDEMLHAKRLEALFKKQDGVAFETAAIEYSDRFGGEKAANWGQIASWGAALAPTATLFAGAEPANLDATQDVTSLDTTKLATASDAVTDKASDLKEDVTESVSELKEDITDSVADVKDDVTESVADVVDEVAEVADDAKDAVADTVESGLDTVEAGVDESIQAEGLNFSKTELEDALDNTIDSGSDLGGIAAGVAATGAAAVGGLASSLGDDLDELDATAAALDDELLSMETSLEDNLEMTDLEATLAGDTELEDLLDATAAGGDDFEFSLAAEGVGAADDLSSDLSTSDLEAELLNTDATGTLGGLSEELDLESSGLSLSDETTDADLTITGDEVDTMVDLARAYIDMGDMDSAKSTIADIIAAGNSDQVALAKELESQLS